MVKKYYLQIKLKEIFLVQNPPEGRLQQHIYNSVVRFNTEGFMPVKFYINRYSEFKIIASLKLDI